MPWAHCTGRGSSWRWMEKNMNQWSILKKNHSGRLVIPLFLALSFLRCSMPRGELWEILRSYQPFTSCRTNDRVNGIRERGNIPPNSRIVAIWQLRWPPNATCYTWRQIWRDNSNGSTAHAHNSRGAIDPEPRPPLSPVPRPTMAGAFYPKSAGPPFSQTTSATTSRPSQTTYNAAQMSHIAY